MIARTLTIVVLFLNSCLGLAADDWIRYVDPRFGSAVDVPSDFSAHGQPDVAGEGRIFRAQNGRAKITIWGGSSQNSGFMGEIGDRIDEQEAQGWAITYRSQTPDWASWSGARGGHVFYAKAILTCEGKQTVNVRLDYPAADVPSYDAIVNRLGQSLGQDGGCF